MNITVGTYNILHGLNYPLWREERKEDINLSLASDAIRRMGLDICGLNEVRNQENVEGLCNQARVIGENLGYHYVFAKAINHRGGEYGNALVSRYPVIASRCIPIAIPKDQRREEGGKYEDRVLLVADLQVEDRVLTVMVCHFGLCSDEVEKAIETVRATVAESKNPTLFMGDFNIKPDSPYYRMLCEFMQDTDTARVGDENTFPSHAPNQKIDYIFFNDQCQVHLAWIPEELSSDHRPYVAKISM